MTSAKLLESMTGAARMYGRQGASSVDAARWAMYAWRRVWPDEGEKFRVFTILKSRVDADRYVAAVFDGQIRNLPKPTARVIPAGLLLSEDEIARIKAPPPLRGVRELCDAPRHAIGQNLKRPVAAWAVLLAMRLEIASVQGEVLRQLSAARVDQRAELREEMARRKGWKLTRR